MPYLPTAARILVLSDPSELRIVPLSLFTGGMDECLGSPLDAHFGDTQWLNLTSFEVLLSTGGTVVVDENGGVLEGVVFGSEWWGEQLERLGTNPTEWMEFQYWDLGAQALLNDEIQANGDRGHEYFVRHSLVRVEDVEMIGQLEAEIENPTFEWAEFQRERETLVSEEDLVGVYDGFRPVETNPSALRMRRLTRGFHKTGTCVRYAPSVAESLEFWEGYVYKRLILGTGADTLVFDLLFSRYEECQANTNIVGAVWRNTGVNEAFRRGIIITGDGADWYQDVMVPRDSYPANLDREYLSSEMRPSRYYTIEYFVMDGKCVTRAWQKRAAVQDECIFIGSPGLSPVLMPFPNVQSVYFANQSLLISSVYDPFDFECSGIPLIAEITHLVNYDELLQTVGSEDGDLCVASWLVGMYHVKTSSMDSLAEDVREFEGALLSFFNPTKEMILADYPVSSSICSFADLFDVDKSEFYDKMIWAIFQYSDMCIPPSAQYWGGTQTLIPSGTSIFVRCQRSRLFATNFTTSEGCDTTLSQYYEFEFETLPCFQFAGIYAMYVCLPLSCNGIEETSSRVCSGHGDCVDIGSCSCSGGYSGVDCENSPPPIPWITQHRTLFIAVIVGSLVGVLMIAALVGLVVAGIVSAVVQRKKVGRLYEMLGDELDILVAEKRADDGTTLPRFKVKRSLFQIEYKSIKIVRRLGAGGSGAIIFLVEVR